MKASLSLRILSFKRNNFVNFTLITYKQTVNVFSYIFRLIQLSPHSEIEMRELLTSLRLTINILAYKAHFAPYYGEKKTSRARKSSPTENNPPQGRVYGPPLCYPV